MGCRFAALLHTLGRDDEAKERLETLLMMAPDHEPARELLAAIEET